MLEFVVRIYGFGKGVGKGNCKRVTLEPRADDRPLAAELTLAR